MVPRAESWFRSRSELSASASARLLSPPFFFFLRLFLLFVLTLKMFRKCCWFKLAVWVPRPPTLLFFFFGSPPPSWGHFAWPPATKTAKENWLQPHHGNQLASVVWARAWWARAAIGPSRMGGLRNLTPFIGFSSLPLWYRSVFLCHQVGKD